MFEWWGIYNYIPQHMLSFLLPTAEELCGTWRSQQMAPIALDTTQAHTFWWPLIHTQWIIHRKCGVFFCTSHDFPLYSVNSLNGYKLSLSWLSRWLAAWLLGARRDQKEVEQCLPFTWVNLISNSTILVFLSSFQKWCICVRIPVSTTLLHPTLQTPKKWPQEKTNKNKTKPKQKKPQNQNQPTSRWWFR